MATPETTNNPASYKRWTNGISARLLKFGEPRWRVYTKHGVNLCDVPDALVEALPCIVEAAETALAIGLTLGSAQLRDQLCELIGAVRKENW